MAVKPLFDEKNLLAKVAGGDQRAFTTLFELHQQTVFSIAYKLTKSRSHAKEVVQDVFLKLWGHREQLTSVENFSAYLYRIARNQGIDALRAIARQAIYTIELAEEQLEKGDLNTLESIDYKETSEIINRAVETLSPQQRKVYQLCHEQGLKYEEAALELGLSAGTVHSHMKQALKNIRLYIKQLDILLLAIFLMQK